MSPELANDVPALNIRIAQVPADHPLAAVPPGDIAPCSQGLLAWTGWACTLFGWGETLRLEVEGRHAIRDAARKWDAIRTAAVISENTADLPEAIYPPIALASFGFAWATPGVLIVPEVLIVDSSDSRIVIAASTAGPAADPIASLEAAAAQRTANPVTPPRGLVTASGRMTQGKWTESVRRLVNRLRSGSASKVVMSRDMVVSSAVPIDQRYLHGRLHELYPMTWAYAVDGLVGATPEMLASMSGGQMVSRVLAGTIEAGADRDLLSDSKERTEHLLAVESVARAIAPLAETLEVPEEPTLLELPNVTHLSTDVRATLSGGNVLDAVAALHPTAAVCGTPTPLAFDLLVTFEQTRRGRYSGPVGWIDGVGEGEFGIALRCGQIDADGHSIRVFAGAGIMPDSVPEAELAETRAKMRPVLDALGL